MLLFGCYLGNLRQNHFVFSCLFNWTGTKSDTGEQKVRPVFRHPCPQSDTGKFGETVWWERSLGRGCPLEREENVLRKIHEHDAACSNFYFHSSVSFLQSLILKTFHFHTKTRQDACFLFFRTQLHLKKLQHYCVLTIYKL